MADVITAATDTLTVGEEYSKVTWTSGQTELNAAHMNHIEGQLEYLTNKVNTLAVSSANNSSSTALKAPINHADSSSKYGLGTTSKYGHVKTYNGLGRSSYVDGEALSSYQGYLLNQKIVNLQNGNLSSAVPTMRSVELLAATPYIDFHYGNSTSDYTSRIMATADQKLTVTGNMDIQGLTNGFKMKGGSIVLNVGGGNSAFLFNNDGLNNILGSGISNAGQGNISILATNGHGEAQATHVEGVTYLANEGNWYVVFDRHVWGLIRINYVIFYWG